jgi:hypothetical protein
MPTYQEKNLGICPHTTLQKKIPKTHTTTPQHNSHQPHRTPLAPEEEQRNKGVE